jgi:hypothetical protein
VDRGAHRRRQWQRRPCSLHALGGKTVSF